MTLGLGLAHARLLATAEGFPDTLRLIRRAALLLGLRRYLITAARVELQAEKARLRAAEAPSATSEGAEAAEGGPHDAKAKKRPGALSRKGSMGALGQSKLLQVGGAATTLQPTGEQWDWPNAWPPLQQMLVEGIASCGAPGGAALAQELAARCGWLRTRSEAEPCGLPDDSLMAP